jgi:PDZ domain
VVRELVTIWAFELLKGLGRVFAQPLFYYGVFLALLIGWLRVKKERRYFHVRVYHSFHESKFLFISGLLPGLVLSFFMVGIGFVLPSDTLILLSAVTILFGLTLQLRLLSPAYTVGLTFFCASFLVKYEGTKSFFAKYFSGLTNTNLSVLVLLLGMLLFVEAWLILKNGSVATSPQLTKSKRGLLIGVHWAERLWFVPAFVPVPGEAITAVVSWWPVFSANEQTYSFLLVPFLIGFSQRIQGTHPSDSVRLTAKRVRLLAFAVSIVAAAGYWYAPLTVVAAAVAFIGREWVAFYQRFQDDSRSPLFSQRQHGLVILGIIPHSPAEKMGLQVGEIIVKTNGLTVKTEEEFYEALQRNRAFCKLEVLNRNGEIRFVQGALYEDEHHELGLLFVQNEKKWESAAG